MCSPRSRRWESVQKCAAVLWDRRSPHHTLLFEKVGTDGELVAGRARLPPSRRSKSLHRLRLSGSFALPLDLVYREAEARTEPRPPPGRPAQQEIRPPEDRPRPGLSKDSRRWSTDIWRL